MTARAAAPSSSWPPEDVLTGIGDDLPQAREGVRRRRMNLLDLDVFSHKPAGTR